MLRLYISFIFKMWCPFSLSIVPTHPRVGKKTRKIGGCLNLQATLSEESWISTDWCVESPKFNKHHIAWNLEVLKILWLQTNRSKSDCDGSARQTSPQDRTSVVLLWNRRGHLAQVFWKRFLILLVILKTIVGDCLLEGVHLVIWWSYWRCNRIWE